MIARITDKIAEVSGSLPFLLLNAFVFTAWIVVNSFTPWRFDSYPFQFLTLSVSLEAIFLSLFILASQNRQAAADRLTNQKDLAIDTASKKEIGAILAHLDNQDDLILKQEQMILEQSANILTLMKNHEQRQAARKAVKR